MFIYLASPYSHPLQSVKLARFEAVMAACAALVRETVPIYSPILHWHPVTVVHALPDNDAYWQFHNDCMMEACSEMWVLAIAGLNTSVGVRREIEFVDRLQKPITYILPEAVVTAGKLWRNR